MAGIPKQEGMGFLQQGEEEHQRRGSERKKTLRPEGSVVVDMEGLSLLVDSGVGAANTSPEPATTASPRAPMILQNTLTRKFSQLGERKAAADGHGLLLPTNNAASSGGGRGAAAAATPTAAAVTDAPTSSPLMAAAPGTLVEIVLSPAATSETTATAAAAAAASRRPTQSCRRAYGRRAATASPWLEPRRVLLFFATLSSMGTIILLYFTLSIGKMGDGGDANARQ